VSLRWAVRPPSRCGDVAGQRKRRTCSGAAAACASGAGGAIGLRRCRDRRCRRQAHRSRSTPLTAALTAIHRLHPIPRADPDERVSPAWDPGGSDIQLSGSRSRRAATTPVDPHRRRKWMNPKAPPNVGAGPCPRRRLRSRWPACAAPTVTTAAPWEPEPRSGFERHSAHASATWSTNGVAGRASEGPPLPLPSRLDAQGSQHGDAQGSQHGGGGAR
jgi:hypothetical protein